MTVKVPRPGRPPKGRDAAQAPPHHDERPPATLRKDVEHVRGQLRRFRFATVHETEGGEFFCAHRQVSRAAVTWLRERGELALKTRTWGPSAARSGPGPPTSS